MHFKFIQFPPRRDFWYWYGFWFMYNCFQGKRKQKYIFQLFILKWLSTYKGKGGLSSRVSEKIYRYNLNGWFEVLAYKNYFYFTEMNHSVLRITKGTIQNRNASVSSFWTIHYFFNVKRTRILITIVAVVISACHQGYFKKWSKMSFSILCV